MIEVRIGNMFIREYVSDADKKRKYWIENKEGEGMSIDADFWDKELESLFNKHF